MGTSVVTTRQIVHHSPEFEGVRGLRTIAERHYRQLDVAVWLSTVTGTGWSVVMIGTREPAYLFMSDRHAFIAATGDIICPSQTHYRRTQKSRDVEFLAMREIPCRDR